MVDFVWNGNVINLSFVLCLEGLQPDEIDAIIKKPTKEKLEK